MKLGKLFLLSVMRTYLEECGLDEENNISVVYVVIKVSSVYRHKGFFHESVEERNMNDF